MNFKNTLFLCTTVVGVGAFFLVSDPATSQSAGGFVALQATTPGTSQSGNVNITGKAVLGSLQIASGAAASKVLTSDGSGNATWQSAPGFSLPYTGSASVAHPGSVFSVGNTGSGNGVFGIASFTSGTGAGGYFQSNSPAGFGVHGLNPSTSGEAAGGKFVSMSPTGSGVLGLADAAGGVSNGGFFKTASPMGRGVYGLASSAAGGTGTGGYFETMCAGGFGVHAIAMSPTGTNVAGKFENLGLGVGVHGTGSPSAGTRGGLFETPSTTGIGVEGFASSGTGATKGGAFYSASTTGNGVYGSAYATTGVNSGGYFVSESSTGRGVTGLAARVTGENFGGRFETASSAGYGVYGIATHPDGGVGVYGRTAGPTAFAVWGKATSAAGSAIGGLFESAAADGFGVSGIASNAAGDATGGYFISEGPGGTGAAGRANGAGGTGVSGHASNAAGLTTGVAGSASSGTGRGVYGIATDPAGANYGVRGDSFSGAAGYGVYAGGRFAASGTKAFRIDHPLDPYNQYLHHYCAEGPEPLNIYAGEVTTDSRGDAWVMLPDYFMDINKDFRYSLTIVDEGDGFVQAKIAKRIVDGRFKIRTSKPNIAVSWEVKGTRNDAFVRRYGVPVETTKPASERGKLQHAELANVRK